MNRSFHFAGVESEAQNRWLFEVWGSLGRPATGDRNRLKAERWKGLPTGHKTPTADPGARPQHLTILCAPLQSSAALLCSRQPAQKHLRLVHTSLETPRSKGNMTAPSIEMWLLFHLPQLCSLFWDENEETLAKSPPFLHRHI